MTRALSILILILFHCCSSFGHNFNISFTKLSSIESGLSQSTVNALIRDSKGDFWVGTHQGLNRYTLHGLYSYFTSREDSLSLPNNYIYDIIEDGKGRVWIATKSGVAIYNRSDDNFELQTRELMPVMLKVDNGVLLGSDNFVMHVRENNEVDTVCLCKKRETEDTTDTESRAWRRGERMGKCCLGP